MWELDYKESWAPKNWCFWTVVLERTLESPLNCKEIKLVNPKGNKSWIFIGRTDAEAEAPTLWPVQFSHSVVSDCLQPHGLEHPRPPCPSLTPRADSNSCPSSWWCHPTNLWIFHLSQHQGLFQWVGSSHQVAKLLELQLQHQSFQWIFRTDFL